MNFFKTIRTPLFNVDGAAQGNGDQQPGKTFTQEDLDRIVGERLTRERAARGDYDDLKEVADLVKEFGYQGSVADIKAQLRQESETRRKAAEMEQLKQEAATSGTSPELLSEMKALQKRLDEIESEKQKQLKEMEAKQQAENAWNAQVQEFQTKHADVDMEKLAKNEKFMKFLSKSNPSIPFVDVYETYIDLVGDAEAAAIEKIKSNADRSTFSGKSKADPSGGTFGLNESQQALAKSNGMTYKEYADLLKDIN